MNISKGEYLVQCNEIPKDFYIIKKGVVRAFYLNESGKEFTRSFVIENQPVASLLSLIFNKPKNEFVANFVGSHNVISQNKKKFAIRMDQIKISKTSKINNNTMVLDDIEFQGENVKLICSNKSSKLQILIEDKKFYKEIKGEINIYLIY